MNRAFKKYGFLCALGVLFLILAVVLIVKTVYSLIFVSAFIGVMILNSAGRRIIYLLRASRALEAGKEEVLIYYRDGNLVESNNVIICILSVIIPEYQ